MRWVTAHQKKILFSQKPSGEVGEAISGFLPSLTPLAVHELLFSSQNETVLPLFPALLAAKKVLTESSENSGSKCHRKLAWIDPLGCFYPPAAIQAGVTPEQLCLLRPRPADSVWATIESLRCQSMAAVVALLTRPLSRVEVRRLQLAAESGRALALLIRPSNSVSSHIYAAATRWLVRPMPGERIVQRWQLQLIHGH